MRTIRWGVIGTGAMARAFAEDMRRVADCRLVAVASRDPARARAFAARYGAREWYGDFHGLTRGSSADIVYVATPNTSHMEQCLAALDAGRAVLCEKPFAMMTEQARRVVDAARARGAFCMEAMWMRCLPSIRWIIDRVRQGAIGEVRHVAADFGYPVAEDPGSRFYDPDLGGGALLDRGVYTLAFAQAILGHPRQVVALAERSATGVDRQSSFVLTYEHGALATLSCRLDIESGNEATIAGTRGIIRVEAPFFNPPRVSVIPTSSRPTWPPPDPTGVAWLQGVWGMMRRIGSSGCVRRLRAAVPGGSGDAWRGNQAGAGYHHEIVHVNDCLRAGRIESPWMPLDDTLDTVGVMERIRTVWRAS